jgi:predicted RNase H-like HicB family nuclease
MKTQAHYPITTHWSAQDGEWVATSPAWPALSALEATPQKAVAELQKVIRLAAVTPKMVFRFQTGKPLSQLRLQPEVVKAAKNT